MRTGAVRRAGGLLVAVAGSLPYAAGQWAWEAQCIGQWLQCGGINYWGPTNCCPSTQCEYVNDYWWQCNPAPAPIWVPTETRAPTAGPIPAPSPVPTPSNTPAASAAASAAATVPAATVTPTPAPTRRPHHHHPHTHHSHAPTTAPTPFPTSAGTPIFEKPCYKVRRNILSLSQEEIDLVIEGFYGLKASGTYDNITAIHGNPATFGLFHANNYFLPWHRWYVLKIEDAIRALGGKFACFSMPYWDWTLDAAGNEAHSPLYNFWGHMGFQNESFCMRTGPWANWTNSKGGCLKRIGSESFRFFTPAEITSLILDNPAMNGAFRPSFESGAHARPHLYLGGAMNSFASPDDPIFWLHHCFVDKIYTMWQDCHTYLDPLHITETMFLSTEVDTVMAYTEDVTPRKMWNVADLGYTYETDVFSAFGFINQCHWYNFKPNPALIGVAPPAFPTVPPTIAPTVAPTPTPGSIADKAVDASTAAPSVASAPSEFLEDPEASGENEGSDKRAPLPADPRTDTHLAAVAPKATGAKAMGGKMQKQAKGQSQGLRGRKRPEAKAGKKQQKLQLKEEGQGQGRGHQPLHTHGLSLIAVENAVYEDCLARGRGRAGDLKKLQAKCRKEVLKHECRNYGPVCDLPDKFVENMGLQFSQQLFKSQHPCARTCRMPPRGEAEPQVAAQAKAKAKQAKAHP